MSIKIDDALTAWFIARADLLAAKLAAGRPQDLVDAEALRAAEGVEKTPSSESDE